jgi:putative ABC transport system permease protein
MTRLFVDRLDDAAGRPARAGLWIRAVADVAVQAGAEWALRVGRLSREGMKMGGWVQDLRLALRGLKKRPGFTAAAAGTLALGLGAVVALFSVVDAVLLRPLPYPDSDELVVFWKVGTEDGERGRSVDHPDLDAWSEGVPGLQVLGYASSQPTLLLGGEAEVATAVRVTGAPLSTFGVSPYLGRDLTRADDVPDGPRVVVLSHAFWSTRLAADPDVLGTSITLSGEPWEIVGVAPERFAFPGRPDLLMPRLHQAEGCQHGCNVMVAAGRLPDGTDIATVEEQLRAVDARLAELAPDEHGDVVTDLQSMHEHDVADVRTALWVLMGAVALVLLIACANVANLMIVRGAGRSGEMAVRATLGASRGRLVRQLLAEALVLAGMAGILGTVLAYWGIDALVGMAPEGLPRMDEVALDPRALGFAALLVALVTVVFGLLPARRIARVAPASFLHGGTRVEGGRRSGWSRSLLLGGEVALSLVLLLGAGLMLRTLAEIRAVELGYQVEHIERFRLSTPESRYDTEETLRFFSELEDRLAALPSVEAAGHAFGVPFAPGSMTVGIELRSRPDAEPAPVGLRPASPGYLEALRIPLVRGRWFTEDDVHEAEAVAVVNEAAARVLFPEGSALGERFSVSASWGFDDKPAWTVVGVVGDTRVYDATQPDIPTVYVPNAQFGVDIAYFTVRRAAGSPSILPQARQLLGAMDPELAMTTEESLADAVGRETASTRFYMTLLGIFSVLAVVLAAVGLYGVVAYSVSRRMREIGIRRALGARAEDVVGLVVRQGVAPALVGVAVGLGGAWIGARAMSALLYGVTPGDPLTLVGATLLLLLVVLLATLVPARRAAAIHPGNALREE